MRDFRSASQRIFTGLAGSYEQAVDLATLMQDRRWKRWVTESIGGANELVLDVGCGTLLFEERLACWGGRFVGLDLSREMITVGRAKALGNVDLVINGDAESLPFPECSFDSVVSCYVAKYVDPRKFAGELLRVLRVGGTVALYDFAKPKGALAPFLGLYIQGGLRGLGFLLRLARRSSAFTYSNLPRIIEESEWEGKMVETMEGVGFQTLAAERLTGVVFAYSGRKSPSN